MQKEHMQYALVGIALDFAERGDVRAAEHCMLLSANDWFIQRLAEYSMEADEDELVNHMIEERIKRQQTGKKKEIHLG